VTNDILYILPIMLQEGTTPLQSPLTVHCLVLFPVIL